MRPTFDIEPVIVWQPIPGTSQEIALDSRCRHTLYSGSRGPGKALALTCPVPTPSGWKFHGDLRSGDLVFGADGSAVKVLETHPVQTKPFYRLSFNDGASLEACVEHLWSVSIDRGSPRNWRLMITLEIKQRVDYGLPVRLPARPAVKYPIRPLPIDPYLLDCVS